MFDPYAPDFLRDPYPTYARLRRESPIFHHPTWDLTFFARHADISAILRDRRFGRDIRHAVPAGEIDPVVFDRIYPSHLPSWTALVRDSFIDLEPPRHTRIRRLVQSAFTRRASESYRARLVETADRSLAAAIEQGRMEAIADYATPIPLTMIAELLGVPGADQPRLVAWSHAIIRVFDQGCTETEGAAAETAIVEFVGYLADLLADRRARPRTDLVTALAQAEIDGDRLTDQELIATCILILNAGHEATVQAIGNSLLALSRHRDEYHRLRGDPGLVPTAAAELLRYDTPLQMFERWVLEDLVWGDIDLTRGRKVGLLFGSANRDPARFDQPDRLRLDRLDNPHVSFGAGIHHCVGAPLALIELEVAIARFAAAVGEFEVEIAHPERTASLVFRGVKTLPMTLTR